MSADTETLLDKASEIIGMIDELRIKLILLKGKIKHEKLIRHNILPTKFVKKMGRVVKQYSRQLDKYNEQLELIYILTGA